MEQKKEIDWISKDQWAKDPVKGYLWIHLSLPLHVMVFVNNDDPQVICLWIKTKIDNDFASNYFVYSLDVDNKHPLDYALQIIDQYHNENNKDEENVSD